MSANRILDSAVAKRLFQSSDQSEPASLTVDAGAPLKESDALPPARGRKRARRWLQWRVEEDKLGPFQVLSPVRASVDGPVRLLLRTWDSGKRLETILIVTDDVEIKSD